MLKKVFQKLTPAQVSTPPKQFLPKPAVKVTEQPTPVPNTPVSKIRVLFVCIGNSCRSPMALGFAQRYGADVMIAESAGVFPIHRVDPASIRTMQERNIDISSAFPKSLEEADAPSFDLVVNMTGQRLRCGNQNVEDWTVPDPLSKNDDEFRKAADLLEQMVMRLILQLRLKRHPAVSRA